MNQSWMILGQIMAKSVIKPQVIYMPSDGHPETLNTIYDYILSLILIDDSTH